MLSPLAAVHPIHACVRCPCAVLSLLASVTLVRVRCPLVPAGARAWVPAGALVPGSCGWPPLPRCPSGARWCPGLSACYFCFLLFMFGVYAGIIFVYAQFPRWFPRPMDRPCFTQRRDQHEKLLGRFNSSCPRCCDCMGASISSSQIAWVLQFSLPGRFN